MVELLSIKATKVGPAIEVGANGNISISGKSMMEDAALYFRPAQDWLTRFLAEKPKAVEVEMDLSYFNSSSAKQLLKLLMAIDSSDADGSVVWIFPEDNDVLLERGEELQAMLDMPFQYRPK